MVFTSLFRAPSTQLTIQHFKEREKNSLVYLFVSLATTTLQTSLYIIHFLAHNASTYEMKPIGIGKIVSDFIVGQRFLSLFSNCFVSII